MQALRLLGAKLGFRRQINALSALLTAPVHVSCSRETWTTVFGEPDCIEAIGDSMAKDSLYLWKHFCTDGPITCIGHLFERWPGESWVVVVRVSLFCTF